ncbi:hypothetical protein FDECE_13687 [Fusarium decemcellulare]|nr:hypothetical protein FDECE_13687 [Fusarium decemcellulare]
MKSAHDNIMAHDLASPPLNRAAVQAAHELIKPYTHHTPVLTNTTLTDLASTPQDAADLIGTAWEGRTPANPKLRLFFKCENFQRIGAFKVRGAFHAIERLKQEEEWEEGGGRERGVVTHSSGKPSHFCWRYIIRCIEALPNLDGSGNHAQALSLAARANNIPAYIVMPTISAPPKIAATKGHGANVVFSGSTSAEREAAPAKVVEETGARLIPPYDHPDIVLGQGTLGLELQDDAAALIAQDTNAFGGRSLLGRPLGDPGSGKGKRLDAILALCGGGGMLSGVALSCEGTGIRVFGSEPWFEGADDAKRGYESGSRVEAVKTLTIADGLRTPLGKVPWGIIYERKLVNGFFSVSEDEIKKALRLVLERFKLVIEPSAAVPLAVALYNEDFRALVEKEAGETGWNLGIVFSGGNISPETLGKLFTDV